MAGILSFPVVSLRQPMISFPSGSRRTSTVVCAAATAAPATARNPYEVLRVKETATAAEIKSAYRSLAKRFHPDAGDGRGDVFVEIHRAYATLSDPDSRSRVDASIRRPVPFRRRPGEMITRRWETDQCW